MNGYRVLASTCPEARNVSKADQYSEAVNPSRGWRRVCAEPTTGKATSRTNANIPQQIAEPNVGTQREELLAADDKEIPHFDLQVEPDRAALTTHRTMPTRCKLFVARCCRCFCS